MRVALLPLAPCFAWRLESTAASAAGVPRGINFQGQLRDGGGDPVANASYLVIFTIYDAPTAGSAGWAETTSVPTVNLRQEPGRLCPR
jgi:hypothetical protein